MNRKMLVLFILLLVTVMAAGDIAWAQTEEAPEVITPGLVSFQGQVSVNNIPFTGTGYFKFVVINAGGSITQWSNDGSSTSGSEPTSAVPITVANGLFSVLLGDTSLPGMTRPMYAGIFNTSERYLRIWFSPTGSTFTRLEPDRRFAAVPYALQAENANLLAGLDAAHYQYRVNGTCAVGSSIRVINADGTVQCDPRTTFYTPLLQAQSLSMGQVDISLKGFHGGFTDGRYAYFVPHYNGFDYSGMVGRLDLQNFTDSGVTSLDLTEVDTQLKGFVGGFTDGRYGYFVPNNNGSLFGKLARVDLQNFAAGGVTVLDLTTVDSGLQGFHGGFTDGRYGYLVPFQNSAGITGKVARVDLLNFTTSGVSVLSLGLVDNDLRGFDGGFTDGRYGYFVPNYTGNGYSGKVARLDLLDFSATGVTALDLAGVDARLKGFSGGFTDGRYGYFVPNYNGSLSGVVARVDLQNFTPSGVTVLDLPAVESGLEGFIGGFTDGRYAYFVPYQNNAGFTGKLARVDLLNFTTSGVTSLSLGMMDSGLKGFKGGFTDGRYGYLVPNQNDSGYTGKVARIQLFSGAGAP